jgi:hypothetical protein
MMTLVFFVKCSVDDFDADCNVGWGITLFFSVNVP